MGKPSIFNNDYHKIMRRRKIIFRTLIILAALAIIFVTYDKTVIPNLKKMAENIKLPVKSQVKQPENKTIEEPVNDSSTENNSGEPKEQKEPQIEKGEYPFKLSNTESIAIIFEKKENDMRFTGIKPDNMGVSFDIREDGKAMVFDNPRTSDVWICTIEGKILRLNPDNYKQYKENGGYNRFDKADIMEEYDNNYIWASKPKFLKDGRIVYQSNLPWFLEENKIYLWVVNNDGSENKMCLSKGQAPPVKYSGFADDGRLIIELGGSRYILNIDDRSIHKLD